MPAPRTHSHLAFDRCSRHIPVGQSSIYNSRTTLNPRVSEGRS